MHRRALVRDHAARRGGARARHARRAAARLRARSRSTASSARSRQTARSRASLALVVGRRRRARPGVRVEVHVDLLPALRRARDRAAPVAARAAARAGTVRRLRASRRSCSCPSSLWNARHDWISFRFQLEHGLGTPKGSALNRELELLGGQLGLVSPILFAARAAAVWRALRRPRDDVHFVLAVVAVGCWAFFVYSAIRRRVEANWPAPAYIPALVLLASQWSTRQCRALALAPARARVRGGRRRRAVRLRARRRSCRSAARRDPLARAAGWDELAMQRRTRARRTLGARVWVGADRYQDVSELAYHLPGRPEAFCVCLTGRHNQYDLWPSFAVARRARRRRSSSRSTNVRGRGARERRAARPALHARAARRARAAAPRRRHRDGAPPLDARGLHRRLADAQRALSELAARRLRMLASRDHSRTRRGSRRAARRAARAPRRRAASRRACSPRPSARRAAAMRSIPFGVMWQSTCRRSGVDRSRMTWPAVSSLSSSRVIPAASSTIRSRIASVGNPASPAPRRMRSTLYCWIVMPCASTTCARCRCITAAVRRMLTTTSSAEDRKGLVCLISSWSVLLRRGMTGRPAGEVRRGPRSARTELLTRQY